jgi:hypothetical protein
MPNCSKPVHTPLVGKTPEFSVGQLIRLRGKPEKARRVIAIEWHMFRHEFAYTVETSAQGRFRPYWFSPQLELVTTIAV